MTISDKISSIRETMGGSYTKPSPEKLRKFIDNLESSSVAKDYLINKRGLAEETIKHFNLGYDVERNAIAIPIYKRGELVNIKYRLLDPKGDIRYTQERGAEVWLFNEDGISQGLKKGGVLVVEGEHDLMSAWQAGFKNVISPASGKDSYGIWLELLDNIPKVYIAYDNDKPGRTASLKMAERVGIDKCMEVFYPEGIKDANEYFSRFGRKDFRELLKSARPYYRYKFVGVSDVLEQLQENTDNTLKIDLIPYVEFEEDWIVVVSGDSNAGKTSFVLNVANELAEKKIPTLVMPYERGIKTVGKRFLQVRYNLANEDFHYLESDDWRRMVDGSVNLPLYFSTPHISETRELIGKAKRIFDVKVIIIDHLDYLVRKSQSDKNSETSNFLQEYKAIAQEYGIIFILVHHINKPGVKSQKPRRPRKEDLKGTSALYQDPEAVIMLYPPTPETLEVIIEKNKGKMGFKTFDFNPNTGVVSSEKEEVKTTEDTSDPYLESLWEQS